MKQDKVLIGSGAVNLYDPTILKRAPKDLDYLVHNRALSSSDVSAVKIDQIVAPMILDNYSFKDSVASLDEVYTLKVSHSYWIIDNNTNNWYKHLHDIKALQVAGAVLIPELHSIAYKQWEEKHGKKNINLNQDKSEFFTSGVRRKYDHDSIHAAIAFNDEPLFNKILVDGAEVLTSKQKFFDLSDEDKQKLIHEEVMVLALERNLIPNENNDPESNIVPAFMQQLRLLITQYSKGYFPQYIIENYHDVGLPKLNYWKKFMESDKKILL